MSQEVRERIRPWTHVASPRRLRREKTTIAVPTVDTYRQHMDHVQTAYQRLRLDGSGNRTQTASPSSASRAPSSPSRPGGFPSILPYRMTRSHTFTASPRHWRGAAAWNPLLEFSSLGPSSRRSSLASPDPHRHEESSSRVSSRRVSAVNAPAQIVDGELSSRGPSRRVSTVNASAQVTERGCCSARTVGEGSLELTTPVRKVSWVIEGKRRNSQQFAEDHQRAVSPPQPHHPSMPFFALTREETKILSHADRKHKGPSSDRPEVLSKTNKDEDASSSGVSSRSSSSHDHKEDVVTSDPHAVHHHGDSSSRHVPHNGEVGSPYPVGEARQAWESGDSARVAEQHELTPRHAEQKSRSARPWHHRKKSLGYSDQLSSLDEPMDILQLAEHLKTRGLGDPVMSTHSHNGPQTRALPPGMKARCLPRNPSTREKIKGRARLDQELANMRAAAFCEQQRSRMFRTASADLRDRDVRMLEEEERENVHKDLNEADKARRIAMEIPDDVEGDDDDDVSSMVCSPLSREELFCRIEAWAHQVDEALHRADHSEVKVYGH